MYVCCSRPRATSVLAGCPALTTALCAAVPATPVPLDSSNVHGKVSKENPRAGGSHAVIQRVAPFPLSQSQTKVPAWLRWETMAGYAVPWRRWKTNILPVTATPGLTSSLGEFRLCPGVSDQDPAAVISAFWFTLPARDPALPQPWLHF